MSFFDHKKNADTRAPKIVMATLCLALNLLTSCKGGGSGGGGTTLSPNRGTTTVAGDSTSSGSVAPTLSISAPTVGAITSATSTAFTITYSGAAAITLNSARVSLVATGTVAGCTVTVTGSGVVSRTVTLTTCAGTGTVAITITSGSATNSAGLQASGAGPSSFVTVTNSNPAVFFLVSGFTSPITACTSSTITVTAKDAGGVLASTYVGTVHLTSSDTQAVLPADYTFTLADAGTKTFTVTLKTAGTQSITATDTVTGSINGSQTLITVNYGAAVDLRVGTNPSTTAAAATITPAVTVRVTDGCGTGNTVTSSTATVGLTLWDNPVVATLSGTLSKSAVAGIATFSNLSVDRPASGFTLLGSSAGLTTILSSSFTINPGDYVASAAGTVINTYSHITDSTLAVGATSMTLGSATGFYPQDKIMIIQMQNSAGGTAGQYEIATIASIATNTITLTSGTTYAYSSGTFNTAGATAAQAVRIPRYATLTVNAGASITATAWNGFSGGIVAADVTFGTATITIAATGSINANAVGYRGGAKRTTGFNIATQGESTLGTGSTSLDANSGGGGGGYTNNWGTGGGGGGYVNRGSSAVASAGGSVPGQGGNLIGSNNLRTLVLGSGGGGGSAENNGNTIGGDGGIGAGIIYLNTGTLSLSGNITANGGTGNAAAGGAAGSGGGGSGGAVYLYATNISSITASLVTANGGAGGATGSVGGAGSVGAIGLFPQATSNLVIAAANQVINNYTHITNSTVVAGATSFSVGDSTGFSTGDTIMILQTQTAANGTPGLWEKKTISSIAGNNITLTSGTNYTYYSGTFGTTSSTVTQIIRVPQLTTLTVNAGASITANNWNGYSGGVIAFDTSSTVSVAGSISANGRGFYGGQRKVTGFVTAYQGESITGIGTTSGDANQGGGGGGYTGNWGSGGGGAGYVNRGAAGAVSAGGYTLGQGGHLVGTNNLRTFILGSGGGGGSGINSDNSAPGQMGGAGGGLIYGNMLGNLTLTGSISSNGNAGDSAVSGSASGAGGGGSGGSIYLNAPNMASITSSLVTATGGTGGAFGSTGGAGSAGAIRLDGISSTDPVITIANHVLNDYTHITNSTISAGASSFTVGDSTGFNAGDKIMILQTQSAAGGVAGRYEFKTIQSIAANTITLTAGLYYTFYSGTFGTTSSTVTQIVRIPQLSTLTINAGASLTSNNWNGYSGGVVAYETTGAVSIAGSISVNGRGFYGGQRRINGFVMAYQGESITGIGATNIDANQGGGGGGYTPNWGSGGGGGGYVNRGSVGTTSAGGYTLGQAGQVVGTNNLRTLVLGSGGGGGTGQNSGTGDTGQKGGAGGGVVYANMLGNLTLTGTISANGIAGDNATSSSGGAGGGGSGGGIYLYTPNMSSINSALVTANGGAGGTSGSNGGAGSVGAIKLDGISSTDPVIMAANQVVNEYTHITDASVAAGTKVMNVGDSSGFSVGDNIAVVQMQNNAGGVTGQFEPAVINSISGNTITLNANLANTYYSGTFNTSAATSAQIIKYTIYNTLTVNAGASLTSNNWNGYSGGIVAVVTSGALNIAGTISVSGRGYWGGQRKQTGFVTAFAGESTKGVGAQTRTTARGEGGGGNTNNWGSSGGGGAYGAAGTAGSNSAAGTNPGAAGSAQGAANMSVIVIGSGGGGGSGNNSGSADSGQAGGAGAGLIVLNSASITVTGSVLANGAAGGSATTGASGSGGGGSGGGIYFITSGNMNVGTNLLNATGGAGGTGGANGGAGSVGRIRLQCGGSITGTTNPTYN